MDAALHNYLNEYPLTYYMNSLHQFDLLFPKSEAGKNSALDYLKGEGLLRQLSSKTTDPEQIPPNYCDLARLHFTLRSRKAFTVLEFGVGYSTYVMADAITKNRADYIKSEYSSANKDQTFHIHSVDSSEHWIENTKKNIPPPLNDVVSIHYSKVFPGAVEGRACHLYSELPDVVPDFIYIDGPDPTTVTGSTHGLSWAASVRPVMSADLLYLEPCLYPGSYVMIDGRTLNARFLASQLRRTWAFCCYTRSDITTGELQEFPVGERDRARLLYQLGERVLAWKNPITSLDV